MMDTQSYFSAALIDPSMPVPNGLRSPLGGPAGARFDIYRNNVVASLVDAMQAGFPVIEKLVGPANFKTLAIAFVRAHPPQSPVLVFYGQEFPAFLEGFEPLQRMPYMADVARLELFRRDSYHAADAPTFDGVALQSVGESALMAGRLVTAPATRIITSDYPIYDIWQRNTHDPNHAISKAGQTVLITRPEFDVEMIPLSSDTARFLQGLDTGTVGQVVEQVMTDNPNFPLGEVFALILQSGFATRLDKVTT